MKDLMKVLGGGQARRRKLASIGQANGGDRDNERKRLSELFRAQWRRRQEQEQVKSFPSNNSQATASSCLNASIFLISLVCSLSRARSRSRRVNTSPGFDPTATPGLSIFAAQHPFLQFVFLYFCSPPPTPPPTSSPSSATPTFLDLFLTLFRTQDCINFSNKSESNLF